MLPATDTAARRGAAAEPWFAVWLAGYRVITNHGNLAASYADTRPLTRKIDCTTETVIESDTASPFGGFANFNVGNTHPDPEGGVYDNANEYIVTLSLDVEASDPLVPEAPSVGADLWITLDPMAGTVAVNGLIDHWPAFEGYASADGGGAVVLFQIDPAVGTDPYTLLEPRDVPVSVSVQAA